MKNYQLLKSQRMKNRKSAIYEVENLHTFGNENPDSTPKEKSRPQDPYRHFVSQRIRDSFNPSPNTWAVKMNNLNSIIESEDQETLEQIISNEDDQSEISNE